MDTLWHYGLSYGSMCLLYIKTIKMTCPILSYDFIFAAVADLLTVCSGGLHSLLLTSLQPSWPF